MSTLLAIESAGGSPGVALSIDGLITERSTPQDHNLSGNLIRCAEELLAGKPIGEVDAFAVNAGPGGFTAIKIGVTLAKTWAHVTGKELIAVGAFQALLHGLKFEGDWLAALPARKDAVYWVASWSSEPLLATKEALFDLVRNKKIALFGAGAERWRDEIDDVLWLNRPWPCPRDVLAVALELGKGEHPFGVQPVYVQPPSITMSPKNAGGP